MGQPRWGRALGTLWLGVVLTGGAGCAGHAPVASWDPVAFRDLDTLEFRTVGPEEGEHWSTVWLVVVDDAVYVRLGSRAAERMQRHVEKPLVAVRIGGKEYPRVRAEERTDMVDRVATAMGEKYWTDLVIRYVPHPLTMQLRPEPAAPAAAP